MWCYPGRRKSWQRQKYKELARAREKGSGRADRRGQSAVIYFLARGGMCVGGGSFCRWWAVRWSGWGTTQNYDSGRHGIPEISWIQLIHLHLLHLHLSLWYCTSNTRALLLWCLELGQDSLSTPRLQEIKPVNDEVLFEINVSNQNDEEGMKN